jgi:hypothetical protein
LETGATRCHFCGSTKVSFIADPVETIAQPETAHPEPAEKDAGITIIFDKGHDHPAEAAPAAELEAEPQETAEGEEEPSAFSAAWQWAIRPAHAALLGVALLVLGGGVWWILAPRRVQVQEVEADPRAVDPVLARDFSALVDAALPEKLEWGREILRHRVPSRFPEELLLDTDREKAEIRFLNDEKTEAYYRCSIAYHYKETNKKIFSWMSAQFFFELRNGKWFLSGDRWPREWEVVFE